MDLNKTGAFIRNMRNEKGITQEKLAEMLHVTRPAVSKWERGLSFPDVDLLEPLSSILGVSVSELLKGEKDMTVEANEPLNNLVAIEKEKKAKRKRRSRICVLAVLSLLLILIIGNNIAMNTFGTKTPYMEVTYDGTPEKTEGGTVYSFHVVDHMVDVILPRIAFYDEQGNVMNAGAGVPVITPDKTFLQCVPWNIGNYMAGYFHEEGDLQVLFSKEGIGTRYGNTGPWDMAVDEEGNPVTGEFTLTSFEKEDGEWKIVFEEEEGRTIVLTVRALNAGIY